MKVLLDENIPHELRPLLLPFEAYTVQYMKWGGIRNGDLMTRATGEGFEAILTFDKGMGEQKPAGVTIRVVCLRSKSRDVKDIVALLPQIIEGLRWGKSGKEVDVR